MAAIGSIFGVWAFILNFQRTAILKRKEKERLESKKKAKFSVDRTKEMGSNGMQDKFILQNIGEAEAKNVEVEFYNYDRKGDGSKRKLNLLMYNVPSKINAGQTTKTVMSITGVFAPPYEIVITWDDDFEVGNKIEYILN